MWHPGPLLSVVVCNTVVLRGTRMLFWMVHTTMAGIRRSDKPMDMMVHRTVVHVCSLGLSQMQIVKLLPHGPVAPQTLKAYNEMNECDGAQDCGASGHPRTPLPVGSRGGWSPHSPGRSDVETFAAANT
jgi:hypothetical protein